MQFKSLVYFFLFAMIAACESNATPEEMEAHRPSFHFTPPANWMNDPNGMVYHEGEYHLFYQYYPDSTVWGPMHWGHAISTDLVNWDHLPVALYPDKNGWIFSGSAVVDHNNTSGLGKDGIAPMIAIFTYHNAPWEKEGFDDFQTQGIAYSLDKGRTWIKYDKNPVLKNPGIRDFRDPKVRWYAPGEKWIMALAVQDHISFYSSPNLLDWTFESDFGKESGAHGGVWECPDLFPLPNPSGNEQKWVLLVSINPGGPNGGSATQYFIGDFDGKTFAPDNPERTAWLDYGKDNYAGVTWSNIPESDGRTLFMGWMSNWEYAQVVPTDNWRSAMTLPRSLALEATDQGLSLKGQAVAELSSLREKEITLKAQTLPDSLDLSAKLGGKGKLVEMVLELELPEAGASQPLIQIRRSNELGESYLIGFDAAKNAFFSDRTQAGKTAFSPEFAAKVTLAPRQTQDRKLRLHLYFDRASAELFADDGLSNLTEIFFPTADFDKLSIEVSGGTVQLSKGSLYNL